MPFLRLACGLGVGLLALPVIAAGPLDEAALAEARAMRERALADDTACELIRPLTAEVGSRFAGSTCDARAVAWAVERPRAGHTCRRSISTALRGGSSTRCTASLV
jgi:hypothetical protein